MTNHLGARKSKELEKFSNHSSELLLGQGRLPEFFAHLGYPVEAYGEGFRGLCPACQSSLCFIGLNGKVHRVYWRCFDRACPSNRGASPLFKNLLGLVRGRLPGQSLGAAIKVIAKFLGYEGRSFDITNGKFRDRAC